VKVRSAEEEYRGDLCLMTSLTTICMVCGQRSSVCSCMSPSAFEKFMEMYRERSVAVVALQKIERKTDYCSIPDIVRIRRISQHALSDLGENLSDRSGAERSGGSEWFMHEATLRAEIARLNHKVEEFERYADDLEKEADAPKYSRLEIEIARSDRLIVKALRGILKEEDDCPLVNEEEARKEAKEAQP